MKYITYFIALLFISQRISCRQSVSSLDKPQQLSSSMVKFDSSLNCFVEVNSIALGTLSFNVQIDTVNCKETINVKGRSFTPFFNLADSSVIAEKNVTVLEANIKVVNNQVRLYVKQQITTTGEDGYFDLHLPQCDNCALIFSKNGFHTKAYALPQCK